MKNATLWFIQVENSFEISKIVSDRTKLQHLSCALPVDILEEFQVLLGTTYSQLKNAILEKYAITPRAALQEFCGTHSLGAQSASTTLRKLQGFLRIFNPSADIETDPMLKNQFENALPRTTRAMILCKDFKTLPEMANFCDEIMSIQNSTEDNVYGIMRKQYSTNDIDSSRAAKALSPNNNNGMCYYHRRFGKLARKCQTPCSWKISPSGNEHEEQ